MVCLTFSTHYRILRTGDQTRDEAFAELGSELSLEDQVRLADSVDSERCSAKLVSVPSPGARVCRSVAAVWSTERLTRLLSPSQGLQQPLAAPSTLSTL